MINTKFNGLAFALFYLQDVAKLSSGFGFNFGCDVKNFLIRLAFVIPFVVLAVAVNFEYWLSFSHC